MQFNETELAYQLRKAEPLQFDKEGKLYVFEECSGNGEKKAQGYKERWFRLRGNMLFYYSSEKMDSDALGLFVLERVVAQSVTTEDSSLFHFHLVFENDDQPVSLATTSAEDRDEWIEAINTAGSEYLKRLILSLRDQLMNKMGHFLPNLALSVPIESDKIATFTAEEGFIEISLRCNGLPCGPGGEKPNTMIVISSVSDDGGCHELARTEIQVKTCNPVFMKNLCFSSAQVSPCTQIKLEAKDVLEGITRRELGYTLFTIDAITSSPENTIECDLGEGCGTITVTAWQDDSDSACSQSYEEYSKSDSDLDLIPNGTVNFESSSEPPSSGTPHTRTHVKDHVRQLSVWFGDIVTKAFRFPAQDGTEIKVHEFLGESKLTFSLPEKLITIWRDEDQLLLQQLEDIGKLPKIWENVRVEHIEQLRKSLRLYNERLKFIEAYDGPLFVPSLNLKRLIRHTEFLPTNLHEQRLDVMSDQAPKGTYYDTTTCGIFTAFTLRYREGGLRKLGNQFREQFADKFDRQPRLEELWYLLTYVNKLQTDINSEADVVCSVTAHRDNSVMNSPSNRFFLKVRQLLQFCEQDLLQESLEAFADIKKENNNEPTKKKRRNSIRKILNFKKHKRKSSDANVNSTDHDSWAVLKSTVETLSATFRSKTENILSSENDCAMMSEEVELLTRGVLTAIEKMCQLVLNSLTFMMMVETSPNVSLWHTIRFRRNLCFSQGLTSVTVGVLSKISSSIRRNREMLEQIPKLGILVSFECLLSCFSDEIAMLDDMISILDELDHMKFRIFPSQGDQLSMPRVCQLRPYAIMEIPLPQADFELLPDDLRDGHLIDIQTAMFNIGVNEQATLGEKLGIDDIQTENNKTNFEVLSKFKDRFLKIYPEPVRLGTSQTLSDLMSLLEKSLNSKKSRNAEVLHLSDEICRMMRAFRFTSCKSSRDRTSMGITLEEVMILQREHQLASNVFMKALDCIRTDGVRRVNAIKNTGKRHYDFSTMRVMTLPRLYKPPTGCYRPI